MSLPKHIAIIMDGNGRWALARGLLRASGHRAGVDAVQRTIEACLAEKIPYLSLFAFSSENWNRPKQEVEFLMTLFQKLLHRRVQQLHGQGVRLRVIGDRSRFSVKLNNAIHEAERLTANNERLCLVLAVNYGGCWDIASTAQKLAAQVQAGDIAVADITPDYFLQQSAVGDLPLPDLFIRTSGEQRLSNFFLMPLAYTELYFTPVLWPDFDAATLKAALNEYALRQRRFGGTECNEVKSA